MTWVYFSPVNISYSLTTSRFNECGFIVVRSVTRDRKCDVMCVCGPETLPLMKTCELCLKWYKIHDEGVR